MEIYSVQTGVVVGLNLSRLGCVYRQCIKAVQDTPSVAPKLTARITLREPDHIAIPKCTAGPFIDFLNPRTGTAISRMNGVGRWSSLRR